MTRVEKFLKETGNEFPNDITLDGYILKRTVKFSYDEIFDTYIHMQVHGLEEKTLFDSLANKIDSGKKTFIELIVSEHV